MTAENTMTYDAVRAHVAASTEHVSTSDNDVKSPCSNDSAELAYRVSRFECLSCISLSLAGGAEGLTITTDVVSLSPVRALGSIAVSRTVASGAAAFCSPKRHSGIAGDVKLCVLRKRRRRRAYASDVRGEKCASLYFYV